MKLLWICNLLPGEVKKAVTGKPGSGLWVDHVLSDLRKQKDLTIHILCPCPTAATGTLDACCTFATFRTGMPYEYLPELETRFRQELTAFQPDVIHSWGVEYAHTLAMVNAAKAEGLLDHMVISIQGLCSFISDHYCEGIPAGVQHSVTFRDLVRRDNIAQQQKKFVRRGDLEKKALQTARYIMGRTHWDEACTGMLNPDRQFFVCRETLRQEFYDGGWEYNRCRKHRIFCSSCAYPVKGFHYLLEAFAQVLKTYPDATLAVPGHSYLDASPFRKSSYQKYLSDLTRKYGMEDKIEFLGSLSAEQMKNAYLESNVFALPSTIENSPNSLGEAMLLGVPCVAADVGGVTSMITHEQEGYVYPSTAPYMLAHYIKTVFAMEEKVTVMTNAAREHARRTHDPEQNLRDLLTIYHQIRK